MIKYEQPEQAKHAAGFDLTNTEFSMVQIVYHASEEEKEKVEVVCTDGSNKIYESEEAKEQWVQIEWKWDEKRLWKVKEQELNEEIKKLVRCITTAWSSEEK